jgi:hypothetical protein
MIAAEILQCEWLDRPVRQMAVIAHIGEMQERVDRGHADMGETTALRIRETLGVSNNVYKLLQILQEDGLIRQGPVVRVRWRYSAPCYELTPQGWELYHSIRRVVQ